MTCNNYGYRIMRDEIRDFEDIQYSDNTMTNALYILDPSMKLIGSIEGLAKGERIYSARFTGPVGYMVTYREMDPLFALDLSNPTSPRVTSALKIPGFSTYLHPFGEDRLLGLGYNATGDVRNGMKISMFDTSDSFDVTELLSMKIGSFDSEALSEHKAVLVDLERGLFGFPAYDEANGMLYYYVFHYDDENGFTLQGYLRLGGSSNRYYGMSVRGLIIDEHLYVFSAGYGASSYLDVFDLEALENVAALEELSEQQPLLAEPEPAPDETLTEEPLPEEMPSGKAPSSSEPAPPADILEKQSVE
jgi:uncharacterized secreted protein with C-terminal beta-propeller domain